MSATRPCRLFSIGMIARSNAMARIFALVQNLQASDATILLTGDGLMELELISPKGLITKRVKTKGFLAVLEHLARVITNDIAGTLEEGACGLEGHPVVCRDLNERGTGGD